VVTCNLILLALPRNPMPRSAPCFFRLFVLSKPLALAQGPPPFSLRQCWHVSAACVSWSFAFSIAPSMVGLVRYSDV
jgi:hypothetical protein